MNDSIERNLGEQPIAHIMKDYDLEAKDLVENSIEQLSYKMVTRACKGRRLTPNVKSKIRNAINKSIGKSYSMNDLFSY